jgi:molecular chaperone HscB
MSAIAAAAANPSASDMSEPSWPARLTADDFSLFQLPRQFALVREDLDARWKALQREAHPDRFAAEGQAAQRVAMQWSVRINEAYQRLKDPLRRAAYLCELAGVPIDAERNTAMPTAFLQQQMAWREQLEEAQTEDELLQLHDAVRQARVAGEAQLHACLDTTPDVARAAQEVRALMFVARFAQEVERRLDALAGA